MMAAFLRRAQPFSLLNAWENTLTKQGFMSKAYISTATQSFSTDGKCSDRVCANYNIYKGKAALSASPRLPQFTKLDDSGSLKVDRQGTIFSPAIGERKYDWEKKQFFALSPTEIGSLISLGPDEACEFLHDPSMKSSNAGQVRKTLQVKPHADGSGYFTSLTAAASPSTLFTTNNRRRDSPVGRAFPISDVVVNGTIFTPRSPIRLASPLSNGIGGGVRSGWEAKRSYSILNGLGNEEDVKVPFKKKKKSFTKICMVVKTFEKEQTFPADQHKISLPTKRSLFTVLRSPHVHKKSREQFFLTTKKQHLVIQAERHELAKKYFWLKRHRIMGAQFELKFFCKTRFQLVRGTDGLNDNKLYDSRES